MRSGELMTVGWCGGVGWSKEVSLARSTLEFRSGPAETERRKGEGKKKLTCGPHEQREKRGEERELIGGPWPIRESSEMSHPVLRPKPNAPVCVPRNKFHIYVNVINGKSST